MESNNNSRCRICLEPVAIIPIFENNDSDIQKKFSSCFNEKIEDVEGYPRHICSKCNNTLDIVCNFISKYKESCKLLENGLCNIKKEENDLSDNEMPVDLIDSLKLEPDEDVFQELLIPPDITVKRIKKQENKIKRTKKIVNRKVRNAINKVTSSLLEGEFKWTGDKWCLLNVDNIKKCVKPNKTISTKVKRKQDIILPKPPKEKVPVVQQELCDLCGMVFSSKEKLKIHQKSTHLKNPIKCTKCNLSLVSEYYLSRHMKRRHSDQPREYVCKVCNKGFAYRNELNSHIKNVHNKHLKPKQTFSCKMCNKVYKCRKSVVVHERSVHTGHRPAECIICEARFYHEDYLRDHMRLHTGETPFKCPICSRGYAQLCNMKSHLRIHKMSDLDAATLSKLRPSYIKLLKENRNR